MTRLIAYADLDALGEIAAEGYDTWGQPSLIGVDIAKGFAQVTNAPFAAEAALPGFLVLSLIPRLVPQPDWSIVGHSGVLNLGCPTIRFPTKARVGAALQGRRKLAAARHHPRGALMTLEFEVREAGKEEFCMLAQNELLYLSGQAR